MLPMKAVRIRFLDEHLKPTIVHSASGAVVGHAVASGFLFRTAFGLFVATCWHAVTGVQSFDHPVVPALRGDSNSSGRRVFAEVLCQGYETQSHPGIETIGGEFTFRLQLLDHSTDPPWVPLWWQHRRLARHADLVAAQLARPDYADLVLIKVPDGNSFAPDQVLSDADIWFNMVLPTDAVSIAGFPYGYNPNPISPTPVLITRNVATALGASGGTAHEFMIDGMAAPGMSGGPVFHESNGKPHLCGIYTGCRFPDQVQQPDRVTALGLVHAALLLKAHNVKNFKPYVEAELVD